MTRSFRLRACRTKPSGRHAHLRRRRRSHSSPTRVRTGNRRRRRTERQRRPDRHRRRHRRSPDCGRTAARHRRPRSPLHVDHRRSGMKQFLHHRPNERARQCFAQCSPQSPDSGRTRRSWTSSVTTSPTSTRPDSRRATSSSRTCSARRCAAPAAPAAEPGRYQPRAGRSRCAPRRRRHELLAGRDAADGSFDRLRDPGRRLLRRRPGRHPGVHAQRQLLARRHGQLVTGDGGFVQGWQADPNGNVNTNASVGHAEDPGRSDHHAGHDDAP